MPKFGFMNRNKQWLAGQLDLPVGAPQAYAIFAHCFTCSKNAKAATQVSRGLADRGVAVLRFDFTGLGNSEGDFANSNFSSNVSDLLDAATALSEQHAPPTILIGHSLGGAAVLLAAAQLEHVRAVATIAAPAEPAHVERLISETTTETHQDGSLTVRLGGREMRVAHDFIEDLKSNRVADSLPNLRKPLLIFHSPTDAIVSIDNARRIYETAKHPKSFISVDRADHMLSAPADGRFVAATLAAWASRYLPDAGDPDDGEQLEQGAVEIVEQQASLTQRIRTRHHTFHADEPTSQGGHDVGPNPYELLLAALGACTSMTLRLYARRKKWPVESIRVRLRHSRMHAKDCEACESSEGFIDQIDKQILVAGEIDDDQRARLAEIADRCPVHRTLLNDKQIHSQISRETNGR